MAVIARRTLLAAAGTAAAAASWPGKPYAQELHDLSRALRLVVPPIAAPDIAFVDAQGRMHHLSEFRGRGVVVNLWATWCAPCVAEMPSLATLSKTLVPAHIAVLPLSSDTRGAPAVAAFFRKHAIAGLPVLLDPRGAAERAFGATGLPTSVIIDSAGQETARLEGAADWASPQAAALVRKLAG